MQSARTHTLASGAWAVPGRGFGSLVGPTLRPGDGVRRVAAGERLRGWDRYCQLVAEAYRAAPDRTAAGVISYTALARHIETMFRQMKSRVGVQFVDYDPYATAEQMNVEVAREGTMRVSSLFNQAEFFGPIENLEFRAIHDYLAHLLGRPGGPRPSTFDLRGELIAYNRHAALLKCQSRALPALFSEVLGQACHQVFYGQFPDKQKIVVLEDFDPCYIGRVRGYDIVNGDLVSSGASGAIKRSVSPRKQTERDERLGSVARAKVMVSGIGDPLWYPGERVTRSSTRSVQIFGEDEDIWLLATASPDGRQGRVLISLSPHAGYLFGGAHWVEEAGRRCVSSIWIESEYRNSTRHARTGRGPGVDFGGILAEMLREIGVSCVFAPVSTAGTRWAERHGFAHSAGSK